MWYPHRYTSFYVFAQEVTVSLLSQYLCQAIKQRFFCLTPPIQLPYINVLRPVSIDHSFKKKNSESILYNFNDMAGKCKNENDVDNKTQEQSLIIDQNL